ncbi:transcriptional regulator [Bacillus toyonensis]|uniref:helix-turn-helix domain-containing protein n=1 Tax=Bacillus toyonensis TaxID=155322 RepID=UPI000BEF78EF|nr:helix-turn-helix transcriptional regulator [Bacillus toyonensis]PEO55590.1 transcriptional regulator [Bacillus toyonensis]PFX74008.1 transcriptional regulator [Bacillus toyonensis]PFX74848.1 transcriptional regulator [Bacillus toyonensis]PGB00660.1 transcriptional regulator [Bacillus toyonensis]PHF46607.1 transcriptional regulator [Bacillus toyonensis]
MLGKKIAELRKNQKLSQYDLAERLGFSRGKLANYEQGQREPDYDTLKKIADYFEVSTDYLLGRDIIKTEANNPLADPELGLWFKDIKNASPDKQEELRQFWEFIKNKEKNRKPEDKQK